MKWRSGWLRWVRKGQHATCDNLLIVQLLWMSWTSSVLSFGTVGTIASKLMNMQI
jgi:hypothetical protein